LTHYQEKKGKRNFEAGEKKKQGEETIKHKILKSVGGKEGRGLEGMRGNDQDFGPSGGPT